ncbi:MAG TPA: methyltransferase domain-containing protein [Verrucomicrobiae bacterium]
MPYATGVNFDETQKNWTALGEHDAMWVVLTDPDKKGNRWKREDFFATGQREIADVFTKLQQAGVSPLSGRVLDFGCGLGRLSQALAARFALVDGVDISASMIRQAKEFNQFSDRVTYHVNSRDDLAGFPAASYDFICSLIVLQHIPPNFQEKYIRDFLRLLKPGGVAYFQTVHARGWRKFIPHSVADFIRKQRSHGQPFIPLYGVPTDQVRRLITAAGGELKHFENCGHGEWGARYFNDYFIVQKPAA